MKMRSFKILTQSKSLMQESVKLRVQIANGERKSFFKRICLRMEKFKPLLVTPNAAAIIAFLVIMAVSTPIVYGVAYGIRAIEMNRYSEYVASECKGRALLFKEDLSNMYTILQDAEAFYRMLPNITDEQLQAISNVSYNNSLATVVARAPLINDADRLTWESENSVNITTWVDGKGRIYAPKSSLYLPLHAIRRNVNGEWFKGQDISSNFIDSASAWSSLEDGARQNTARIIPIYQMHNTSERSQELAVFMPYYKNGSQSNLNTAGYFLVDLTLSDRPSRIFKDGYVQTLVYVTVYSNTEIAVNEGQQYDAMLSDNERPILKEVFSDGFTDSEWTLQCIPTISGNNIETRRVSQFTSTIGVVAAIASSFFYAIIVRKRMIMRQKSRVDEELIARQKNIMVKLMDNAAAVLKAIPDPILTLDHKGFIFAANEHAATQTGYSKEELEKGMHIDRLLKETAGISKVNFESTPNDPTYSTPRTTSRRTKPRPNRRARFGGMREVIVTRRDGSTFMATANFSDQTLTSKPFQQVVVLRDITVQKSYEASLNAARNEAEAAQREKGRVLLFLCHELRNPLHVIIGLAGMLEECTTGDGPKEDLRTLVQVANYMQFTVDDVSNLSMLQERVYTAKAMSHSGSSLKLAVLNKNANDRKMPHDLQSFVRETLEIAGHVAVAKRQEIKLLVPDFGSTIKFQDYEKTTSTAALFMMDVPKMRYALLKVLERSVMCAAEGGKILCKLEWSKLFDFAELRSKAISSNTTKSVTPHYTVFDPTTVRIIIEDTRVAPTAEILENMFDPYHPANSSQGSEFGNQGLAMGLARSVCDSLGGSLSITSREMSLDITDGYEFRVVLEFPLRPVICNRCATHQCACTAAHEYEQGKTPLPPARHGLGMTGIYAFSRSYFADDFGGGESKGLAAALNDDDSSGNGSSIGSRKASSVGLEKPASTYLSVTSPPANGRTIKRSATYASSNRNNATKSTGQTEKWSARSVGGPFLALTLPRAEMRPRAKSNPADLSGLTGAVVKKSSGVSQATVHHVAAEQTSSNNEKAHSAMLTEEKEDFIETSQLPGELQSVRLSARLSPTLTFPIHFEPPDQPPVSASKIIEEETVQNPIAKSSPAGPEFSVKPNEQTITPPSNVDSPMSSSMARGNPAYEHIPQVPALTDGEGRVIMVVEDNAILAKITKKQLERYGYSARIANNGREAVDLYNSMRENASADTKPISCITMDCIMPICDGFEGTRLLRESGYEGPIIAITANALSSERIKCFSVGMTAFVTKPVKEDALRDIVGRQIAGFEQAAANRTAFPELVLHTP